MRISFYRGMFLASVLSVVFLPTLFYSQNSESQQQEVQSHLQRALKALSVNDPDTAAREYRAALQIDPNNIDARANLGVIAFMQGQYAEATEDFRAALKLQPGLWKVQALLGLSEAAGPLRQRAHVAGEIFPASGRTETENPGGAGTGRTRLSGGGNSANPQR